MDELKSLKDSRADTWNAIRFEIERCDRLGVGLGIDYLKLTTRYREYQERIAELEPDIGGES